MAPNYLDFHNPAFKALTIALAILGVLGFAGVVSLFRLSALQRELRALRKLIQVRKAQPDGKDGWHAFVQRDDFVQRMDDLTLALGELRGRLDIQEQAVCPTIPVWPGETASIQLNRRGQILRLAGKGRSIAEIAVDLGVSQGEVELLLKVQDLGESFPSKKESRNVL